MNLSYRSGTHRTFATGGREGNGHDGQGKNANALENSVVVNPHHTHMLTAEYSVEDL